MDATTARSGRPGHGLIIVLNCGSSSIKFAVFDPSATPLPRQALWNGKVLGIGGADPDFEETGVAPFPIKLDTAHPYRAALRIIRDRVSQRLDGRRIGAVAHRIVHGGSRYFEPVRVDAQVLTDLQGYIPLAPLHQPFALDLYVRRIVREIGALVAVLGGLDMLVFTAGVGEHNAFIRERIGAALGFLNIALDTDANASHAATISSDHSQVIVAIEPTNEEWWAPPWPGPITSFKTSALRKRRNWGWRRT